MNHRESRYSRGPEALDELENLIKEEVKLDPIFRLEFMTHELLHEISGQVRALRKEAGLTQQELADRIEVPQSFIARLENPHTRKQPSLATLAKVAVALERKLVVQFEESSDSSLHGKADQVTIEQVGYRQKNKNDIFRKEKRADINDRPDDGVIEFDLAAAEGDDVQARNKLGSLGTLFVDENLYEVYENEDGHICIQGRIPPGVTRLRLGDVPYAVKPVEGRRDLHVVAIGLKTVGEFLDKHNTNHEDHPATFEYSNK